jgi:hypothetical protein
VGSVRPALAARAGVTDPVGSTVAETVPCPPELPSAEECWTHRSGGPVSAGWINTPPEPCPAGARRSTTCYVTADGQHVRGGASGAAHN